MAKVSIIIPSRGESYTNLSQTIDSIYRNATGDFEVLIGFDGEPQDMPGLHFGNLNHKEIIFPTTVGIKTNLNALCAMATGKYIYKTDAHCSFSYGFNETLQEHMQEDWLVMPRFYVLNGETWEWQDERFYDYFYLCCPFTDPRGFRFKAGGHWPERTQERLEIPIDDTPQIHGSGWFISKDRYFDLGGFPNIDPYGHAQEPIWLALKNQLMGGRCVVNKKAWYAHLHQQGNKRGYTMDHAQEVKSYDIAANTFMRDPRMMGWLEKNFPMPSWPDNWKELYNNYLTSVKQ